MTILGHFVSYHKGRTGREELVEERKERNRGV